MQVDTNRNQGKPREIKINEEMRKSIQRDAIERANLVEVLRHKLILEVLLS